MKNIIAIFLLIVVGLIIVKIILVSYLIMIRLADLIGISHSQINWIYGGIFAINILVFIIKYLWKD